MRITTDNLYTAPGRSTSRVSTVPIDISDAYLFKVEPGFPLERNGIRAVATHMLLRMGQHRAYCWLCRGKDGNDDIDGIEMTNVTNSYGCVDREIMDKISTDRLPRESEQFEEYHAEIVAEQLHEIIDQA